MPSPLRLRTISLWFMLERCFSSIIAPVSDGIHKAEELIKKIEAGEAPIYHHAADGGAGETESADKENLGRSIYKHLMNGVSHMRTALWKRCVMRLSV